jgi:hypothetical protein
MRRDVQLGIITEALSKPVPGVSPANLTIGQFCADSPEDVTISWVMEVGMLARRIQAALLAAQDAGQGSPLAQAEDAKRARDLGGELGALMAGERALTSAAWYPARHGDIVHVHYEQAGTIPPVGETYLVEAIEDQGLFKLRLLCHSHTDDDADTGLAAFEADATDDPLYELWFEAGPQRLTIVRDGRTVHDGGAR